MAGLRQIAGVIKTQFTRAVNWLRPVRAGTLPRIDPPLESGRIPEGLAATNSKVARVSIAKEEPLWYTMSFKSGFTEATGIKLMHLPPPKGLLNLVDILAKDPFQRDQL